MSERRYWNWRITLFFTLVGPPLGSVVAVLVMFLAASGQTSQSASELLSAFLFYLVLFVPFSYVPGFTPALMTGLLAPVVWMLSPAPLQCNCGYRIVTGGFMGAVCMLLFLSLQSLSQSYLGRVATVSRWMMGEGFWFTCGMAAISAAICAAISGFWLESAGSSKPAKRTRQRAGSECCRSTRRSGFP